MDQVASLRAALAANIKRRLDELDAPSTAIADLAGISRSHMSNIINAKKSVTIDVLAKIAHALDCEASELLKR